MGKPSLGSVPDFSTCLTLLVGEEPNLKPALAPAPSDAKGLDVGVEKEEKENVDRGLGGATLLPVNGNRNGFN